MLLTIGEYFGVDTCLNFFIEGKKANEAVTETKKQHQNWRNTKIGETIANSS